MPEATVLCFGTFDVLHKGHEYFLKQARSLGSRLVVSVALDEHVRKLKNKEPKSSQETRLAAVRKIPMVDEAYLSDGELGTYQIIRKVQPKIVAIGHDQSALAEDCQKWIKHNKLDIKIQTVDYLDAEKIPLKLD